ncbi:MAG: ABC transporter substrate-binding protein [Eubacteriales bacterium]|nr:ABC transporter substrate-binding protein [Eubacteriales bacterium]
MQRKKTFSVRALTLLLALSLMFGLTACNTDDKNQPTKETTAKVTKQAAEENEPEKTEAAHTEAEKTETESNEEAETTEPEAKTDAKLQKVTFSLDWTPNTNHTGLYVARNLGYYADEGIEIDIQQPAEDGAETLVAAGHAQFGISFQDFTSNAWAKEEPMPITAVAAIINHNTSGIVSLKEKGIESPGKLAGHNYASWETPTEIAIMKNIVEADNGKWEDVEVVPYTITDAVSGLQTNVDSLWIYYAWDGIAIEQADLDTNYLDISKLNPVFDYYSPIIIANDKFLEEQPDLAKAFMRATAKGYNYAIEHPDEAAKILCDAVPELDPELVKASQEWLKDQYQSDAPYWGYIDAERWNKFYAWLWDEKLIEYEIPADFGFTNDLVKPEA